MVSKLLVQEQDGTPKQICFAHHASLSPTAANELRTSTDGSKETDVELSLLDLADGAARQSAKADLGEDRAVEYAVRAAIEIQVVEAHPGKAVSFYWSPSQSATAGVGNAGGCSGSDAAYSGYSSDMDDALKQLVHIGDMVMTDDAVDSLQIAEVGILAPPQRYGCLVVYNNCGEKLCETDRIESQVVFDPIVPEAQ